MMPWQERVIAEKAELDERRIKLRDYLLSQYQQPLPDMNRLLLIEQADAMSRYSKILAQRIALFQPDPDEPQRG